MIKPSFFKAELIQPFQTAITRLIGPSLGIIAAIFICLVVAGSLLGNDFVASRMTVAAANKKWFPPLFTVVGRVGVEPKPDPAADASSNSNKSTSDAPINAIILTAVLSTFYILFGNFRTLLTLNGLGEYSFFFLAVLGGVILRFREPDLHRPYKPIILIPAIFILVSGFVVVRGAVFAPVQAIILVAIWVLGVAYYWIKKRWVDESTATHEDADNH